MEDSEGGGRHKFVHSYFIEGSYKNNQSKEQREYLLTKRGFTLVAMRFSGKRALKFQLASYIYKLSLIESCCRVSAGL